MADRSKIEWTDSTFNPWVGCTKVSPACDHCYAEGWAKRSGLVQWGANQSRRRTSAANWNLPFKWDAHLFVECMDCHWRGELRATDEASGAARFHPHLGSARSCPNCHGIALKDARRRVFCASLADVFDNEVDLQWRVDLFELIGRTPNLDWLLLTKRIGNAARMIENTLLALRNRGHTPTQWPWPNVWIGATICNQVEADRDIPKLLSLPARIHFVSIEPILGEIRLPLNRIAEWNALAEQHGQEHAKSTLDWVIGGGESGQHARAWHPQWARTLRDQCGTQAFHFSGNSMESGSRSSSQPTNNAMDVDRIVT